MNILIITTDIVRTVKIYMKNLNFLGSINKGL